MNLRKTCSILIDYKTLFQKMYSTPYHAFTKQNRIHITLLPSRITSTTLSQEVQSNHAQHSLVSSIKSCTIFFSKFNRIMHNILLCKYNRIHTKKFNQIYDYILKRSIKSINFLNNSNPTNFSKVSSLESRVYHSFCNSQFFEQYTIYLT